MSKASVLVRAAIVSLFAVAAGKLSLADPGGMNCELKVGKATIGGVVKYHAVGICEPDDCTGVVICSVVTFPGIPLRHICNCGPDGNPCTVRFHGDLGGQGGASCYNNSCENACPAAPSNADRDNDGFADTYTDGTGQQWTVQTCPCPQ